MDENTYINHQMINKNKCTEMAEWKDTENLSLSFCSRLEYAIYYDIKFKYG